jgi:HSP20 family protein
MSQVEIKRVSEQGDRSLPIFAEFDHLADRIRLEAYELFAHRGARDGHALDDWLAAEREHSWPAAELTESNGEFTLKVALAGFEPKEIDITATPGEIMVKAGHEHKESGADDKSLLRWSEFQSNDVLRRVELPASVDVDKVKATLANGLLEITVPKEKSGKPVSRKIELSAPS